MLNQTVILLEGSGEAGTVVGSLHFQGIVPRTPDATADLPPNLDRAHATMRHEWIIRIPESEPRREEIALRIGDELSRNITSGLVGAYEWRKE